MVHPDNIFIARALVGDDSAFRLLYKRHNESLSTFLRPFTQSIDDAEDLAQEAWIRAFDHLRQYHGKSSFATWIRRIGRNVALQHIRRGRRQQVFHDTLGTCCDASVTEDALLQLIDLQQWHRRLPTRMRQVVGLVLEGYTHESIARRLRISAGTSKSQLHKAIRRANGGYKHRSNTDLGKPGPSPAETDWTSQVSSSPVRRPPDVLAVVSQTR